MFSKILRNSYHAQNINTLEDLSIKDKGYIDQERACMVANLPCTNMIA